MKVEFRPEARQELVDAAQWYAAEGGANVAVQFSWALERALQLIGEMPQLGSAYGRHLRAWPLKRFPYTLVYRVQGEVLTVVAVAHQSRAPGYWAGRR